MSPQPIPMDPKTIIDIVIKRRWVVIVPFFLAMIAGIVLSVKLPRIYEASTLILIQPQKVPQELCPIHRYHGSGRSDQHPLPADIEPNQPGKDYRGVQTIQGPGISKPVRGRQNRRPAQEHLGDRYPTTKRRENYAFTITYQGKNWNGSADDHIPLHFFHR